MEMATLLQFLTLNACTYPSSKPTAAVESVTFAQGKCLSPGVFLVTAPQRRAFSFGHRLVL